LRTLRFYVSDELVVGNEIEVPGDTARHMRSVLRLSVNDCVQLFNGDGKEYICRIANIDKKVTRLEIISSSSVDRESGLNISLLQGVSRSDRMDFTIQKAVELGVNQIWPVYSERSQIQFQSSRLEKKLNHWRGVVSSACEQSGRNHIPQIFEPNSLLDTLKSHSESTANKIIFTPDSQDRLLSAEFLSLDFRLLIGPEGGFSENELQLAKSYGFVAMGLGPRVLRTETAAIASISIIQSKLGDI